MRRWKKVPAPTFPSMDISSGSVEEEQAQGATAGVVQRVGAGEGSGGASSTDGGGRRKTRVRKCSTTARETEAERGTHAGVFVCVCEPGEVFTWTTDEGESSMSSHCRCCSCW